MFKSLAYLLTLTSKTFQVLSNAVRSELRKNITDQDKINGLIANFVYYMINPGLRGKKR